MWRLATNHGAADAAEEGPRAAQRTAAGVSEDKAEDSEEPVRARSEEQGLRDSVALTLCAISKKHLLV